MRFTKYYLLPRKFPCFYLHTVQYVIDTHTLFFGRVLYTIAPRTLYSTASVWVLCVFFGWLLKFAF